jgi:hypothetical protein
VIRVTSGAATVTGGGGMACCSAPLFESLHDETNKAKVRPASADRARTRQGMSWGTVITGSLPVWRQLQVLTTRRDFQKSGVPDVAP